MGRSMSQLSSRFLAAVYRWAKQEGSRELEQGFPVLGTVKTPACEAVVKVLSQVPPETAAAYLAASTRRANLDGVIASGEHCSAADDEEVGRLFFAAVASARAPRAPAPSLIPGGPRLPSGFLKASLTTAVKAGFPKGTRVATVPGGLEATAEVQGLPTYTYFGLGRDAIVYQHGIHFHERFQGDDPISLLVNLGLPGGSQWPPLHLPQDALLAVDSVLKLSDSFFSAIPRIAAALKGE